VLKLNKIKNVDPIFYDKEIKKSALANKLSQLFNEKVKKSFPFSEIYFNQLFKFEIS